jgi:hypothetical protein
MQADSSLLVSMLNILSGYSSKYRVIILTQFQEMHTLWLIDESLSKSGFRLSQAALCLDVPRSPLSTTKQCHDQQQTDKKPAEDGHA